ncbi:kinase domain protein, partial (macronuclear) [Tetrahymena thermophila SB210]
MICQFDQINRQKNNQLNKAKKKKVDLMDQMSQNQQQHEMVKLKLLQHIQNRQKIRQMYVDKGIQMLPKQELLFSEINEPTLSKIQNIVYQEMKRELSQKGYDEFRFLGQGAQGLVVLAKEKSTNKRYAIKGIHIKDSKDNVDQVILGQVQQEIKMLNQCKGSPYVVNLLHQIEGNDFIFLVLTECLGTLNEIIKNTQNERLNELSAIKYAKDIAEGLYFIHSKKCLVNDLKMDNILIDYNGNAVVSDFGLADNLPQQSGYAIEEYKGNIICQAPECYDSSKFDIYSNEYIKLGIAVKKQPSQRSEACSLGYLIYTMISGFQANLVFSKHQPLQYNADFQNFNYEKQLRYIIDGLTNFIPRNRLKVKEVLIILKGIISFEFNLDSKFIEVIDDAAAQQHISQFTQDIEYVQGFENKFYPIIKNEKELFQYLNSQIDAQKEKHEAVISELKQKIKEMQQLIDDLLNQQDKQENQKQNIQPFIQNQQANSQQVFQKQPELGHQDQIQKQNTEKKQDVQNYQQNQEQIKIDQLDNNQPTQRKYFPNVSDYFYNLILILHMQQQR